MYSGKTPISLAVIAVLVAIAYASSSGGGGQYTFDISSKSGLTELDNQPVFLAEKMTRPLGNLPFQSGWLSHSGVRVTLDDGSQYLIHKGDKFGISSQTVAVDARHMSDRWKVVESKNFDGSRTVGDFKQASGTGYQWISDNCHIGADKMMKQ